MKQILAILLSTAFLVPTTLFPHNTTEAITQQAEFSINSALHCLKAVQQSATSQSLSLHGCSEKVPRLANRDVCVAEAAERVSKGETFGKVSPLGNTVATSGAGTGIVATAAWAGAGAAASQASVSMSNSLGRGEDLDDSLQNTTEELTSEDSLKQIAVAMATAGAVEGLNSHMPTGTDYTSLGEVGKDLGALRDSAISGVINTTDSTGIENLVIEGGNWDSFKTAWEDNAKQAGIDALSNHLTKKVGDYENSLGGEGSLAKIAIHAGIGCSAASAKGKDCGSGALGAGLAELQSEWLGSNGEGETFDDIALQYSALAAAVLTGVDAGVAIASAKRVDEFNRRLHKSESKALEKEQKGDSEQEKQELLAAACALTRCAEGASKNDPEYKELKSLQDRGDRLKQNNSASYERMAKYQSEGLFGYGKYDKVNDWITENEREFAIAKAISEIGSGTLAIGGGLTLCSTGAGCALGAPIASLGALNFGTGLSELINQGIGGHDYKEGQGVLDSFSLDTHQGAYDPLADVAKSVGIDATVTVLGLGGLKLGGKLARELGEKLGRGVKDRLVIGRGADLNKPGTLKPNEFKLEWPSKLPDYKAEWKINSSLLRKEMRNSRPIRDASPKNVERWFLNSERNILEQHGWKKRDIEEMDKKIKLWLPPS